MTPIYRCALGFLLVTSRIVSAQPAQAPPAVVAGIPVNYDEAATGNYTLPDPLVLANGAPVRDAKTWTTKRRPEIISAFEEQQFGRVPGRPAKLRFDVFEKGTPALNGTAIRKQVTIVFSPEPGAPKADLLIYVPANARGPVPLLLNIGFTANSATIDDPGIKPGEVWNREKLARVPATPRPQGRLNIAPFLAQGFGVATIYYGDIEPDFAEGFPYGVRKHFLKPGQTELAPNEWGAIAAWGWGLSRAMDYFETDKAIDAKRVAIVGISRLGKTVLWAGARDTRFAMVIASCSGESGAALSRRNYGETVKHMTARFGYQFAANYAKYGDRVDTLPVDAHMLVASIAPRPLLLQTGDKDFWSDPKGEFLSAVAAGPVYELLGKDALGTDQMPAAGTPIFHTLGYVMHEGGHGTIPSDWDLFLRFMQMHFQPGAAKTAAALAASAPASSSSASASTASALGDAVTARIDRAMENYRLDAHIPGMVWGVVQDGRLIHVKAAGVRELEAKRPVDADTLFRIASMTKAFTALSILKLRDEGKVALDAPVETYVPEMRDWKYPTADSPKIRVRDLLTHTAGFVTDDPWGDRQTPMPDEDFTKLLRDGVPFSRPPGMAMEYSNLGYALLGRIITNASARPYKDFVQQQIFTPLGMTSTGFDVSASPAERRALGYRWEDDAWKLEPTMAHGAFGAMGGIQTSANDYAKWVAYLLAAWPPRDEADNGPVRRSSVRELAQGANFPSVRTRPGASGAEACRQANTYAMGFSAAADCELGLTLSHGGGYPGYGSHVLLLPDYGVGIFALANRTYSGPRSPVWDAAVAMLRAGLLKPRTSPSTSSTALSAAYDAAVRIFTSGSVTSASDALAMNFLMDRDAEHWARDLGELKKAVGRCDTSAAIAPATALAGAFTWTCEHGRVSGRILLAPTLTPAIQALSFTRLQ